MPEPETRADVVSTADGTIFDKSYYEHDCGLPYEHNEQWTGFFGLIADRLVNDLRPRSSLDAGCAMGFLVEQLYIRGVDAYGVDISEYAISKVPEPVADRCRVASLVEPIDGTYDLVSCIEVLEHMVPDEARKAVGQPLCRRRSRALLVVAARLLRGDARERAPARSVGRRLRRTRVLPRTSTTTRRI